MSGMINKAKEMVDKAIHPEHKDTTTTTTTGGMNDPQSTNAGPHSSNALNKADPRVDSDRDGSHNAGAATGTSGLGSGYGGTTGTTGTGVGTGSIGSHGGTHHGVGTGTTGTGYGGSGTTGTGVGTGGIGSHGTHSGVGTGTTGTGGIGSHGGTHSAGTTGMTGTGIGSGAHGSTNAGPHSSNMANAADPRVDSDNSTGAYVGQHGISSTTGTGTSAGSTHAAGVTGGLTGTHGTGPAPNTAGPHKSDMMNKADPRVDSNLDGSKTVGGDKTYTGAFDGSAEPALSSNSPPDAARHGPSAFRNMSMDQNLPAESDHNRRHSLADTKGTLEKYGSGHK